MSSGGNGSDRMADVVDALIDRIQQGDRPTVDEYVAEHPEFADEIRELFPAMEMIEELGPDSHTQSQIPSDSFPTPESIGDYRILREIGRGGMGVVYEAEQRTLGRHVALKVLPRQGARGVTGIERFRREARAAARLHHTNIVPVFEVGEDNGELYYAMQFIRGQALDEVLKELGHRHRLLSWKKNSDLDQSDGSQNVIHSLMSGFRPEGDSSAENAVTDETQAQATTSDTISERESVVLPGHSESSETDGRRYHYFRSVARVGIQVAEALDYAHREDVVHRDIKPSNLLLDTHSRVWITDFGLAKTDDDVTLTKDGDLIGTARYLAPERLKGSSDGRSDIYGLGLTLYEMLLFRPAYDASDRVVLMQQVLHAKPSRLRQADSRIPRDLETVINKAIEKEPGNRYQTAADMAADLRRFIDDQPIHARRATSLERAWRWCRRNPLTAALTATIVVVATIGFAGVVTQWKTAQEERDDARNANRDLRAALEKLRRVTYTAHVNLARQTWDDGGLQRVRQLLEDTKPRRGETDLRGFEWYYLSRLCSPTLSTVTRQIENPGCVTFDRQGHRIACVSRDGTIRIWDAKSNRTLSSWSLGTNMWPSRVVFSPDGNRIASTTSDGTLSIWDPSNGKRLQSFKDHPRFLQSVAFSNDGRRIASVSGTFIFSGKLVVRDLKARRILMSRNQMHGGGGVAFLANGKQVVAVDSMDSRMKKVAIFDIKTGKELRSFVPVGTTLRMMAIDQAGQRIAAVGLNRALWVWAVEDGSIMFKRKVPKHLTRLAFSPDGRQLITATKPEIYLWDSESGQFLDLFRGHRDTVLDIAFNQKGDRIVSCSNDQTVRIWNANHGAYPLTVSAHRVDGVGPTGLAVSPDGKRTVSIGLDRMIRVWHTETGSIEREWVLDGEKPRAVVFSPNGRWIETAIDKTVKVWESDSGKLLHTVAKLSAATQAVSFDSQGKQLAVALADGTTMIFSVNASRLVRPRVLKGHTKSVRGIHFSPDGESLATGSEDLTIHVWNAATGKRVQTFKGHTEGVNDVLFTRCGEQLVSVSDDKTVRIWSLAGSTKPRILSGHEHRVVDVEFTPQGDRLATASADGAVKLWDLSTDREVLTLTNRYRRPTRLAFHPNGTRLVTGWSDGYLRIYRAPRNE